MRVLAIWLIPLLGDPLIVILAYQEHLSQAGSRIVCFVLVISSILIWLWALKSHIRKECLKTLTVVSRRGQVVTFENQPHLLVSLDALGVKENEAHT